MKLIFTLLAASISVLVAQETEAPAESKAAKPSVEFMGKTYILSDDIIAGKTTVVNKYYRKDDRVVYLSQRFVMTADDAKAMATRMAKSFEKMGDVTLVHDIAPGISGHVITNATEKSSFVRISIYEQAKNKKGVFVKTWDIQAPGMTKEKVAAIAAKFQKATFDALVKASFPKIVLPAKKSP